MVSITYEVAFFLILVGVIFRLMIPALRKRSESEEPFKWNHRYTWATIFSLAVAFVATLFGIVQYTLPPPEIHWVVAYAMAILEGYGLEAVIIEIAENVFKKEG